MSKHFDFVIENNEHCKKIIRFYSNQSHVHGFNDIAPNNWNEVYKTYMTFSVLYFWKDFEIQCEQMYNAYHEEGEGLRCLVENLQEILCNSEKEIFEVYPFGYGTDWFIRKNKNHAYEFFMVDNFTGKAYRFILDTTEVLNFYNILNDFLEYMLNHSEGI